MNLRSALDTPALIVSTVSISSEAMFEPETDATLSSPSAQCKDGDDGLLCATVCPGSLVLHVTVLAETSATQLLEARPPGQHAATATMINLHMVINMIGLF